MTMNKTEAQLIESADEYGERVDEEIREYISDRGQLVEFDGGIIVSSF
jgi:hypothetical protein